MIAVIHTGPGYVCV